MDYLTPFFNEAAYCLGVEKLLGIEDQIPDRATIIRVMLMELNRLSSHLVAIATGGMELGATTIMIYGFRDRELILDIYELITGLRMNHAYIRPGGLAQDLPPGAVDQIREFVKKMKKNLPEYDKLATGNPIFKGRMQDVGYLDLAGCMALGATGPVLRSTGLPHDLRKTQPYCGYETYDFDVPTADTCDSYGRFLIRLEEMRQSLRIVEQCLDRLQPGPVMVADKKIAWPAQLALGPDGLGNSLDHIKKIMGASMEALIHHFKLVTEGFRVPPGQRGGGVMTVAAEIKGSSPEKLLAPVLSAFWDEDESWTLDVYRRRRGVRGTPQGAGDGAGRPDRVRQGVRSAWTRRCRVPDGDEVGQFIPQGDGKPHYLVVNADESEPGTCKDIPLLFANPHSLIEGIVIACYAIRSSHAFIYLRGEVVPVLRRLHEAVREACAARLSRREHPGQRTRSRTHRARGRGRVHLR
ncbi:NAD(P)H-quinone oxidoreductase subunit H, chloroplastic [Streptomyces violaceorubidus]